MTRKAGEKCGTCRFFVARNTEEAKLATYARDESECGPGEWVFQGVRKVGCHGGPVYGHCQKAGQLSGPGQEPFPPSRVASTFWCKLWRMADGLQIRQSGSVNRGDPAAEANAGFLALGAVALLAAAAQWKRKGSSSKRGSRSRMTGQQWLQWGRDSRLNEEFDGEGQLMFYTDDPAVASEAQRLGASIEKDNEGQLVIYTDVVVTR